MGSTFLNGDRWEDEDVEPEPRMSKTMQTLTNPTLQAQLAAIDARNKEIEA